jgi:hypothetical protein
LGAHPPSELCRGVEGCRQILRVPIARTRKRIAADPREDRLRQLTAPRTQPHRPVIKTLRPWFLLPLTVSKRYLPQFVCDD